MKSLFLICCCLICNESSRAQAVSDAPTIARRAMDSMGGKKNLDKIRFLRFDFEVEVNGNKAYSGSHLWDRKTGRYRLRWNLFGEESEALFNVNTRKGRVFRAGSEVGSAEEKEELLEQAVYNHLNDSYWLLMPWKMTDPGVHLSAAGREWVDGKTFDVLHLSFDSGVGESSGDQHWLYIDVESGMVGQTAYFLERFEQPTPSLEEATVWEWSDWTQTGGVKFATARRVLKSVHDPFETARSRFTRIVVLDKVDDSVFESLSVAVPNQ